MPDDIEALYTRLQADPVAQLGRKSVCLIGPYVTGYEWARVRYGLPAFADPLGEPLQHWAERRFGWTAVMGCRQGICCFARLFAADEAEAFDMYFRFREQARAELGELSPCETYDGWDAKPLVEWLCDEHFRTRTGLYLEPSVEGIWVFCNAYLAAERDLGHADSDDTRALAGFADWIGQRYPFATGRPWHKVIDFLNLHQRDRAKESFFAAFDQYRAGDPPGAMSTKAREILASITKQVLATDSNATFDDVADTYADVLKTIAPS
jgi:hypothetical protein